MEADSDSIAGSYSDTTRILPGTSPQVRRIRTQSRTYSETEPYTLINRDRAAGGGPQVQISSNDDQYEGSALCDPRSFIHRLMALILMCLLGFGSYFCFDNPGALQTSIKDAMHINTYQFSNLYSWYSWPNVVLPIVGGYLMDSVFGIRLGTVIFAVFICLGNFKNFSLSKSNFDSRFLTFSGQVIFALGGLLDTYPLMQIGRFVFGIGGESLAVAQNTYAVSWFKGKELNMVFGFQVHD